MEQTSNIHERLYDIRNDLKLTQQEMADILGVTRGTVSEFENNESKHLNEEQIIRLAEKANVSFNYILGFGNAKNVTAVTLDQVGLSDRAIQVLQGKSLEMKVLNDLLESEHFPMLLSQIKVLQDAKLAASTIKYNNTLNLIACMVDKTNAEHEELENPISSLGVRARTVDDNAMQKTNITKTFAKIMEECEEKAVPVEPTDEMNTVFTLGCQMDEMIVKYATTHDCLEAPKLTAEEIKKTTKQILGGTVLTEVPDFAEFMEFAIKFWDEKKHGGEYEEE